MKLFSFLKGKRKIQERQDAALSPRCAHPVSHQEPLFEDPADRRKVTSIKCTQCGERLRAA